jgi:hypothetical protein
MNANAIPSLFLLWAVTCFVLGCGGEPADETAGIHQAISTPEVRLLSAVTGYARSASGAIGGGFARGYIEVENIAYHKEVVVHYNESGGPDWHTVGATYVGPSSGNREVWRFETPDYPHPPRLATDFRFAIRYTVAGQTFWDNNVGRDYRIGIGPRPVYPRVALPGASVDLIQAEAAGGQLVADIAVKNIAYNKKVQVVYTVDDWATYKVQSAGYRTSSWGCLDYQDAQVLEQWRLTTPIPGGAQRVKMAISYTVNGVTHWDNNQKADYTVDVPGITY